MADGLNQPAPCICTDEDRRGFSGGICNRCGGAIPGAAGDIFYGTDEEFSMLLREIPRIAREIANQIANQTPACGPERTFRCAMCGGTYACGWTEEEARAELASRFPGVDISACDQVCDDCDRELRRRSAPFWRNGVYTGGPETP